MQSHMAPTTPQSTSPAARNLARAAAACNIACAPAWCTFPCGAGRLLRPGRAHPAMHHVLHRLGFSHFSVFSGRAAPALQCASCHSGKCPALYTRLEAMGTAPTLHPLLPLRPGRFSHPEHKSGAAKGMAPHRTGRRFAVKDFARRRFRRCILCVRSCSIMSDFARFCPINRAPI
jgi:hypothetical protein